MRREFGRTRLTKTAKSLIVVNEMRHLAASNVPPFPPSVALSAASRLFSDKDLLRLVVPLIIEQFLVFSLGFSDTIMAVWLGESEASGVSLVDGICVLVSTLFSAMATGGVVVCAHYFGSKKDRMVSLAAKQLIYTMFGIGLALSALGLLLRERLLPRLFGDIDGEVMAASRIYFFYTLLSFPLSGLYSAAAALFRAQGNSRVSMYTSLLVNVLNISGNALCVFALGWGVAGVAIPTLVSRGVAGILLLALLYRAKPYRGRPAVDIRGLFRVRVDFRVIKHILAIGVPNGVENSMFHLGKILVLTLVAAFGTPALTANAAVGNLALLSTLPGSAVGAAVLIVVGQCLGAGKPDEAAYYVRRLMAGTYIAMFAVNIVLLLTAHPVIAVFGLEDDTEAFALRIYMSHCLCAMLIWPPSFALPNALRAANDAKFTMTVSMLSMWLVRVGLSHVFARYTDWSVVGTWVAMYADWTVRGAIFAARFLGGAWRRHYQLD